MKKRQNGTPQQTSLRIDVAVKNKLELACLLTNQSKNEWIEQKADEEIKAKGYKVD